MPPPDKPELPRPRRRLWRTLRKQPRNLRALAPSILLSSLSAPKPADEELAHWGQYGLLEDFVVVLHRDGTPTYRRRWALILHNVKRIEKWEQFEYRFDRRTWKITIQRALMILPDGQQSRARFTNRPCDQWGYSRLLSVEFGHPTPGVVVDLEDQQDNFTPFAACPGVWGNYDLQTAYPCRRRRITLAVARPFEARFQLHNGAPIPAERQAGDYRIWTWDAHDVPGIETDHVTPPPCEFVPWIDFTTLPSWEPVARYYLKELKMPTRQGLEGLVSRLPSAEEPTPSRVAAAYNYVARDVRYSRPRDSSQDRAIRPLGAVIEELRGDCKDKSALLVALLRESNVQARVTLVRTADSGRVSLLPGARFNHALVNANLDGKELWLDPAGGTYSLGQLPSYDQGVQALTLDEREPRALITPAANSADHRLQRLVRGRLEADGSYCADVRLQATGDRAAKWRWGLIERNTLTRERVLRQYVGRAFPSGEITDFLAEHLDDLNGELTISYRVLMNRLARRIRDLLLLRVPWLEPLQDTGFFADASRPQPLLVPIHSVCDRHDVELPPGCSGYGLPMEHVQRCDWGRYQCLVQIVGGALRCERRFELLGGLVPPERCGEIRRFTDACISADASDIVLLTGDIFAKSESQSR